MSFGNLRHAIRIIQPVVVLDASGFEQREDQEVASVRSCIELRHATSAWVGRAAYSDATALFRIRPIPGVEVTTAMEIDCHLGRFLIDSVEVLARRRALRLRRASVLRGQRRQRQAVRRLLAWAASCLTVRQGDATPVTMPGSPACRP